MKRFGLLIALNVLFAHVADEYAISKVMFDKPRRHCITKPAA